MNAQQAVETARSILKDITPLKTDCGRVCGAACCAPDETGKGGMLLFPGEEHLYDVLPEGFEILPDDSVILGGKLLVCKGHCQRDERPLSCMFFPLRPTVKGTVRMDRRGMWVCPLAEYGVGGLNPAFVEAAAQAARALTESPEVKEYLRALGAHIKQVLEASKL